MIIVPGPVVQCGKQVKHAPISSVRPASIKAEDPDFLQ